MYTISPVYWKDLIDNQKSGELDKERPDKPCGITNQTFSFLKI